MLNRDLAAALVTGSLLIASSPVGQAAKPAPPSQRFLVGELVEDGVQRCLADYKHDWVNLYHSVGFTPLKPAAGVDLKPLEGALVVVEGHVDPAGLGRMAPVKHEGPCPMMQMRSDWVQTKSGMRVNRPGMGTVAGAFVAKQVSRWDGLKVTRKGDVLSVSLRNTFAVPLSDVRVTLHYEGCYGKPGSTSETVTAATLAPGKALSGTFGAFKELGEHPSGRQLHAASSIQVRVGSDVVAFDFDYDVSSAGVDVSCKERKGPRK